MAKYVYCKSGVCESNLCLSGISLAPTKQQLRDADWIEVDSDIFCPKCALQALADKVTYLLSLLPGA